MSDVLKNIFSIRNDNPHKILTVFGLKIKIKSYKLVSRILQDKLTKLLKKSKDDYDDIYSKYFSESIAQHPYKKMFDYVWSIDTVKKVIDNPDIKVVSFDIYNTLVLKPSFISDDNIYLLAKKIDKIYDIDFAKMRLNAQRALEDKYPNIDEIYDYIEENNVFLTKDVLQEIKNEELKIEKTLVTIRDDIKELYDYAVSKNKKIIAVSEGCMSESFLSEILKNNGYDKIDKIYVSNECKAEKKDGSIYDYAVKNEKIENSEICHIGGDFEKDYKQVLKKFVTAVYYPSIKELLFRDECIYSEVYEKEISNDPLLRILLGYSYNRIFKNRKASPQNENLFDNISQFISLALEPLLFAVVMSLIKNKNLQKKENGTVNFVARQGYLPKVAYDIVSKYIENLLPSKYVYKIDKTDLLVENNNVAFFENTDKKQYLNEAYKELFSACEPKCKGFDKNEQPLFEKCNFSKEMKSFYAEIKTVTQNYMNDVCRDFGEYITLLDISDFDNLQGLFDYMVKKDPFLETVMFKDIIFPDNDTNGETLEAKLCENVKPENVYRMTGFDNPVNIENLDLIEQKSGYKLGIHIHLYNVHLANEILCYLKDFPYKFDLYITTVDEKNKNWLEKIFNKKTIKKLNKLLIIENENRGRDVAPWLIEVGEYQNKYDLFCHIHTKESPHDAILGRNWRRYLYDNLLSYDAMHNIMKLFMRNEKLGLVFPNAYKKLISCSVFGKIPQEGAFGEIEEIRKLAKKMGINRYYCRNNLLFSEGTMMWYRPQALKPLFDLKLQYADFPEEPIGVGGTLAHVIERLPGFVCEETGYKVGIYNK